MYRYFLITLLLMAAQARAEGPLCLWINSYHEGYEWEDGIGRGLREGLGDSCRLQVFRMDSKRNTAPAFAEQQARKAYELIEQLKPDVVLLSDDNASRYVAVPYLKGTDTPVVFSGINWDVATYDYPWQNASGMVEVAPVLPLLKEIRQVVERPQRGLYLSSRVFTEMVDSGYYVRAFAREHIQVDTLLVSSMREWVEGYKKGQSYDFIVLGNYAGISDWDAELAAATAYEHAGRISVTNYDWMMPYAMVGKTKIPEEQGEWSAQLAREILDGAVPGDIPVVSNRRWAAYINPRLLERAGITLSRSSTYNAIKVK